MSRKLRQESTRPRHASLAVVLQVRDGALQALLWQRGREPCRGAWALPGGLLEQGETLEESIRRHLAAKVDVREVSHLEQLGTYSEPDRDPTAWELATAYLGLVQLGLDPHIPDDTCWHPVDQLPPTAFDHGGIVLAGRDRLRGKLSYSNAGFALAPSTFTLAELREVYVAALGYEVSATNLRRVLERRAVIEPTGERRPSGRAGGRPAEVFRFREQRLAITDPFAALRPRR
ncbi:MAG: NUDIX domain-containing protein [Gaiella sp.]|nr:NUDIX domain-containing protein [Gaiella sp.]